MNIFAKARLVYMIQVCSRTYTCGVVAVVSYVIAVVLITCLWSRTVATLAHP